MYQAEILRVSRMMQVTFIDLQRDFDEYDDLFDGAGEDAVHYNARGHEVVAQAIWLTLQPQLVPPEESVPPPEAIASGR